MGLNAFCKHGQRLLGLGKHLAGCQEKLIRLILHPLSGLEAKLVRIPGYRVRRFYLERQNRIGRIHFMDATAVRVPIIVEALEGRAVGIGAGSQEAWGMAIKASLCVGKSGLLAASHGMTAYINVTSRSKYRGNLVHDHSFDTPNVGKDRAGRRTRRGQLYGEILHATDRNAKHQHIRALRDGLGIDGGEVREAGLMHSGERFFAPRPNAEFRGTKSAGVMKQRTAKQTGAKNREASVF